MPKKYIALLIALIFGMGVLFVSCAGVPIKPTAANFKTPKVALEMIDVPQYDGFWVYSKMKPTKGEGGGSAPLPLAVTFNIMNPNPYPVLLDSYKFTIAFEGFDMVTVKGFDTQWIPAGKTNQLRATTMITPGTAVLSLLVTSGFKLKEKGTDAWSAIEKWWTTIPDMAFPINIGEGSFIFKADGVSKPIGFSATYPK
ncbi:MAG: hypothetical protein JXA79_08360 [Deltaproteobacteria bacterium]|nr:hypothetical protein [Deltaproteobacteria bacterium]